MIKLIHGDALEEMEKISDNSIDLVLTDPPYGSAYDGTNSIDNPTTFKNLTSHDLKFGLRYKLY